MVPRVSGNNVFVTCYNRTRGCTGTGCAGSGTVGKPPTRGLPVLNPSSQGSCQCRSQPIADIQMDMWPRVLQLGCGWFLPCSRAVRWIISRSL